MALSGVCSEGFGLLVVRHLEHEGYVLPTGRFPLTNALEYVLTDKGKTYARHFAKENTTTEEMEKQLSLTLTEDQQEALREVALATDQLNQALQKASNLKLHVVADANEGQLLRITMDDHNPTLFKVYCRLVSDI